MIRPPETPTSVWAAARARRRAVMPAIQSELARISALTGCGVEPQSSFFTDTNLPDETSDLDVALVGLAPRDLRPVAERLMQLPLGEDMACRPVPSREGFLIKYTSPAGIPVDLQVRRDIEVQFMSHLWGVLRSLPDDVKQEIVWAKWSLRRDKKAYKQYKAGLYAAAGFLSDWHSLTGREPVGSAADIIAYVRKNAMPRNQTHTPRVNPTPISGFDVEVTLRDERLGSLTCEIAPGVHMVSQISKTGEHTWVTHGEQRLFFHLQDDQGRRCYFYQSFAGTGGKEQGHWFPSGGLLGNVWVIKGSPKTDPGAGREALLAFYKRVNQVLPHSDADTDAMLKKMTGLGIGDFPDADKFEIKPFLILKEKGPPAVLQEKWRGWAYQFWALHGLTKQWGPRTFNLPGEAVRTNPVRFHIPPEVTAKQVPINVKPIFSRGSQSRLIRAGEVTTPEADVLFILPDANGDFDRAQIQPQRGVLKILVDIRNTGPDRLTPLGLWHRFFQSLAEIASAVPAKERHSLFPGISGPVSLVVQNKVSQIIGSRWEARWGVNISPRTRWWRTSNKEYLGSEALYDSMAMAMTFPGGIVYGVRPVDGRSHPPEVLARLRSFLAPIEKKDTETVRQWVAKQAQRGAVYFTSGDLISDSKYDHRTINQLDVIFPTSADTTPARTNPGVEPGVPDLAGRHIPERYLEGLPRHLQEQRIRELTQSRDEYGKNFKELPTDRAARKMGLVKLSAYREVAQKRGFDIGQTPDLTDMAAAALAYYRKGRGGSSAEISRLAEGLQQVYRKGLGAWKSGGHRPGASARNWSDARVASLLVGGKAAWTADRKQFALLPEDVQAAVIRELPAVYTALRAQGRQRDIAAIQSASGRG